MDKTTLTPPALGKSTIDPQKVWHRKQFLSKTKDLCQAYHDAVIDAQLFIDEIVDNAMKLACSLERKKDIVFITQFTQDQDTMETASYTSEEDYEIVDLDELV